ncbi:MAG: sigma-70 family RNA polymerase sigma factor [Clostridiales bacterium]|nr:sigma-70 family RNA polymerase sigma factor [Clostridiales bacterium]
MCFLYLKDHAMAEDAVQETFLRAFRHQDDFQGESSVKTWITRIAINVCKDMLTDPWARHRSGEDLPDEATPEPSFSSEDRYVISGKIANLPPKYKEVILLHYYQELKLSEIAEILGESEATIKTRLKRARDMLRSELKGVFDDE